MDNNSYRDFVTSLSVDEFAEFSRAVQERHYLEILGIATFKELAELYRPHPVCPYCDFPDTVQNGHTTQGLKRYLCPHCGRKYNQLTSTIFESSKYPFITWLKFLELMVWHSPIRAISEMVGISEQTAIEWRHRVFQTVTDYQNELVLSGKVWIDKTYISDWEQTGNAKKKRGLSNQKYCIAVAIDADKHIFAFVSGKGKPSAKRIKAALKCHIAEGSTIIHDKERAHKGLIDALKATDFSFRADTQDADYLQNMALVNHYCGWLKRYLNRFTGMNQEEHLQDYLNWYVYRFAIARDDEKWAKLGRLVRHLALSKSTFRSSRRR